ncbi:pleckstrin homology domain-containing family G member 4B-like isoform X3 [Branchiostoma lanceolatum]|uniref:pleckstrin homology domain-containing family G member 4B-like isoform X3 n=1 Tax=Branchiostoma lanceolatum TaxID=7740 RepID=UPI0034515404
MLGPEAGLLWALVDVAWIAVLFLVLTVLWVKFVFGAVAGRSRMSGSKSFLHDLDSSIQRTLSTLYPPYHATAPVLLGQVCQIVENRFRGDGMTFLSDWLIPAKPVLQCVREEARLLHAGKLLRHEGWPLCLNDKIVVHLLEPQDEALHPGEFLFYIVQPSRRTARLAIKFCIRERETEKLLIAEETYENLFSLEWLRSVNAVLTGRKLRKCVVTGRAGVRRMDWRRVAEPRVTTIDEDIDTLAERASNTSLVSKTSSSSNGSSGSNVSSGNVASIGKVESDVSLNSVGSMENASCNDNLNTGATTENTAPGMSSERVAESEWSDTGNAGSTGNIFRKTESAGNVSNTETTVLDEAGLCETNRGLPVTEEKDMDFENGMREEERGVERKESDERITTVNGEVMDDSTMERDGFPHQNLIGEAAATEDAKSTGSRERRQHGGKKRNAGTEQRSRSEPFPKSAESNLTSDMLRRDSSGSNDDIFVGSSGLADFKAMKQRMQQKRDEMFTHFQRFKQEMSEGSTLLEDEILGYDEDDYILRQRGSRPRALSEGVGMYWPTGVYSPTRRRSVDSSNSDSDIEDFTRRMLVQETRTSESDEVKERTRFSFSQDVQHRNLEGSTGFVPGGGTGRLPPPPNGMELPPPPVSPQWGQGSRLDRPVQTLEVNFDLLHSGAVYLPGCMSKCGRTVLVVQAANAVLEHTEYSAAELARLLMYFHGIPRYDTRQKGMVVVVDCRDSVPHTLDMVGGAICVLQENIPCAVYQVLVLLPENSPLVDTCYTSFSSGEVEVEVETITDMSELQQLFVEDEVPEEFGGTYQYSHEDWIRFRMKLEPFLLGSRSTGKFLTAVWEDLLSGDMATAGGDGPQEEEAVAEEECADVRLREVLEDPRVKALQMEGEGVLEKLRTEHSALAPSQDYRDSLDYVTYLYNYCSDMVSKLTASPEQRRVQMEQGRKLKAFEDRCIQVLSWVQNEGEVRLERLSEPGDSLDAIKNTTKEFERFYYQAMQQCAKGNDLLEEASSLAGTGEFNTTGIRERAKSLQEQLLGFSRKLEQKRDVLEKTTKLYYFFDKAYEWALEGMKFVALMNMEECHSLRGCDTLMHDLDTYLRDHPPIPQEKFDRMAALANKLDNQKCMEQCKFARTKCRETEQLVERKQAALRKAKQNLEGSKTDKPRRRTVASGEETRLVVPRTVDTQPKEAPIEEESSTKCAVKKPEAIDGIKRIVAKMNSAGSTDSRDTSSSERTDEGFVEGESLDASVISGSCPVSPISNVASPDSQSVKSEPTPSATTSTPVGGARPKEHPVKRLMKRHSTAFELSRFKIPGLDYSRKGRSPTTPITKDDLAVSRSRDTLLQGEDSQETLASFNSGEESLLLPQTNTHLKKSSSVPRLEGDGDQVVPVVKKTSKLDLIMDEFLQTERDYVASLQYIIEHYIPEMDRDDIPQELRGKRGVIFGNLEKIYDFHSIYFLAELESIKENPLKLARCLMKHEKEFYLYALYSKNKPKSDKLMAEHGSAFFRKKQRETGDKMDLASYLLKPVQRMGKYALLLKELLAECPQVQAEEQELADLRLAEDLVKFQLRHGNNLLAMDSLRDCDININEQGKLLRQEEFLVWQGRKKFFRHVFLFEDLILFSKTKRTSGGHDVYLYKNSFKSTEVGLTETIGDSGFKFEIWFRRRKPGETYILQAPNQSVKDAWVDEITKLLWKQACRSKELKQIELASMGIGSKPHLDIKPSGNQISARSIDYVMRNREDWESYPTPVVCRTGLATPSRSKRSKSVPQNALEKALEKARARTRNSIAVPSFEHSPSLKRPHSLISTSSSSSSSTQTSSILGGLALANFDIPSSLREADEEELNIRTSLRPESTGSSSTDGSMSVYNSDGRTPSRSSVETSSDSVPSTNALSPSSLLTPPAPTDAPFVTSPPSPRTQKKTGSHFVTAAKTFFGIQRK